MQTYLYIYDINQRRLSGIKTKFYEKSEKRNQRDCSKKPRWVSVDLTTLKRVTKGISVSYLETQNSFGDVGLEKVIKHAQNHSQVIGGWLNEENGKYYFDSCQIFTDRNKAIEFGKKNQQIAIFDITNLELIKL